jgi:hypothetical protein
MSFNKSDKTPPTQYPANKFDKPYIPVLYVDKKKNQELFNIFSQTLSTTELLKYSLINRISLNQFNEDGENLIHVLLNINPYKLNEETMLYILKFLIENDVNPDKPNKNNITPLHIACDNQYHSIVEYLLKIGVDSNATDNTGNTPFYYLLSGKIRNKPDEKKSMLTPGYTNGKPNDKDVFDIKLYDPTNTKETNVESEMYVNTKIIELLLKYNGDPYKRNLHGISPLYNLIKVYNYKPFEALGTAVGSSTDSFFSYSIREDDKAEITSMLERQIKNIGYFNLTYHQRLAMIDASESVINYFDRFKTINMKGGKNINDVKGPTTLQNIGGAQCWMNSLINLLLDMDDYRKLIFTKYKQHILYDYVKNNDSSDATLTTLKKRICRYYTFDDINRQIKKEYKNKLTDKDVASLEEKNINAILTIQYEPQHALNDVLIDDKNDLKENYQITTTIGAHNSIDNAIDLVVSIDNITHIDIQTWINIQYDNSDDKKNYNEIYSTIDNNDIKEYLNNNNDKYFKNIMDKLKIDDKIIIDYIAEKLTSYINAKYQNSDKKLQIKPGEISLYIKNMLNIQSEALEKLTQEALVKDFIKNIKDEDNIYNTYLNDNDLKKIILKATAEYKENIQNNNGLWGSLLYNLIIKYSNSIYVRKYINNLFKKNYVINSLNKYVIIKAAQYAVLPNSKLKIYSGDKYNFFKLKGVCCYLGSGKTGHWIYCQYDHKNTIYNVYNDNKIDTSSQKIDNGRMFLYENITEKEYNIMDDITYESKTDINNTDNIKQTIEIKKNKYIKSFEYNIETYATMCSNINKIKDQLNITLSPTIITELLFMERNINIISETTSAKFINTSNTIKSIISHHVDHVLVDIIKKLNSITSNELKKINVIFSKFVSSDGKTDMTNQKFYADVNDDYYLVNGINNKYTIGSGGGTNGAMKNLGITELTLLDKDNKVLSGVLLDESKVDEQKKIIYLSTDDLKDKLTINKIKGIYNVNGIDYISEPNRNRFNDIKIIFDYYDRIISHFIIVVTKDAAAPVVAAAPAAAPVVAAASAAAAAPAAAVVGADAPAVVVAVPPKKFILYLPQIPGELYKGDKHVYIAMLFALYNNYKNIINNPNIYFKLDIDNDTYTKLDTITNVEDINKLIINIKNNIYEIIKMEA